MRRSWSWKRRSKLPSGSIPAWISSTRRWLGSSALIPLAYPEELLQTGLLLVQQEGLPQPGQGEDGQFFGAVAEGLVERQVLAREIGAEQGAVVGIHRDGHAASVEPVEGVARQVREDAEADVRGRTDLQGDATVAQLFDE